MSARRPRENRSIRPVCRLCRAAAAAFALLVALAPRGAQPEESAGIFWLDRTGASSVCIGEAATPLCAVETLLACRLRGEATLCTVVGLDSAVLTAEAERLRGSASGPDPFTVLDPRAIEYRVNHAGDDAADTTRVGIALRIHGVDGLTWPEGGWRRLTFALHRQGEGWWVDGVRWQPRLRFIGPREAASRCLGDTGRPVCTIETHIACRVRSDDSLCAAAGRVEGRHFRPSGATVAYIVQRIRPWKPPEPAAPGAAYLIVETMEATQWQPGDRPGEKGGAADSGSDALFVRPGFVPVRYTLERRDDRWRVTGRAERP